jgi:hypothetical protein
VLFLCIDITKRVRDKRFTPIIRKEELDSL